MSAATSVARQPSHEDVFLERYSRLLKWAGQLTRPDHELAKDIVQEAFLQFTLAAGDLVKINNIDNYLHGVVRKIYLSHLRRNARHYQQMSHVEIDSIDNLLLTFDPRRQIQVKDELRAICRHACQRKETSITASILILRFFHGYVPGEIARLTHNSRNVVDVQLNMARSELMGSLQNGNSIPDVLKGKQPDVRMKTHVQLAQDLLSELRKEIFATRQGECIDRLNIQKIYRSRKPLTRATISHFVSCELCLDAANDLHGLPLLRERNAVDLAGRTNEAGAMGTIYGLIR